MVVTVMARRRLVPEKGVCEKCIYRDTGCNDLDFSKMKVIKKTVLYAIVRCTKFKASKNA